MMHMLLGIENGCCEMQSMKKGGGACELPSAAQLYSAINSQAKIAQLQVRCHWLLCSPPPSLPIPLPHVFPVFVRASI